MSDNLESSLPGMHVFFSGIGGTGISALAVIAKQAGYAVSGSDARPSQYLDYLRKKGIDNTYVGISREQIAEVHSSKPIDWYVYGSAQPLDFPDNPEFKFCQENNIKMSKRDEFLAEILSQKKLRLVAIAGTHGKTTTTAMAIWLFKQLGVPLSYSVGAKISFGDMGHFDPQSQYFVYEADEFDRNFLSFYPELSLITGVDWDHPDIYPTREAYYEAFNEFIGQSAKTVIWHDDAEKLALTASENITVLDEKDPAIDKQVSLAGRVNRLDAWLVAKSLSELLDIPFKEALSKLNDFPGVSRRFEQIAANLYTDYAHTPPKIRGALQLAHEVAGDNVVVVYEGLHNTRQHFIKNELAGLFEGVKGLYVVPSYLAREDENLELLTPEKILDLLAPPKNLSGAVGNRIAERQVFGPGLSNWGHASQLNNELKQAIKQHLGAGDLVLCLSAGGTGSLDEWLRQEFA